MKPKHTPGPCRVGDSIVGNIYTGNTPGREIFSADGTRIATVYGKAIEDPERDATAALFAAGPDLAEAAEIALDYVLSEEGSDKSDSNKIRAALAKARGE